MEVWKMIVQKLTNIGLKPAEDGRCDVAHVEKLDGLETD